MEVNASTLKEPQSFRFSPGVRRRLIQLAAQVLFQALVLFIPAGTLRWIEGWVYIAFYLFFIGVNLVLLLPKGAAASNLMEERSRVRGMKGWDKAFAAVYGLASTGILVVAGLDQRLAWSPPIALWTKAVSLVVMTLGYGLFSWAMATNAYFSARVRIQADRGHQVISGGPYKVVRHPGYAGTIPLVIALPVMLGSLWALVPAAVVVVSVIARTFLEDRTLFRELDGYAAYAQRVRYRLVPGIW